MNRPFLAATTLTLVAALITSSPLNAADHQESPALQNSAAVGSLDINDIYIFQSPANTNNTVMILTTNPFAGELSPTTFDQRVAYEFLIDNDGDAVEDIIYRFRFLTLPFGLGQIGIASKVNVDSFFGAAGIGFPVAIGLTGDTARVAGGGQMVFDLFDDPFFFDFNGFNNNFQFTGDDFFAGANTSGIVLEVPSSGLRGGGANAGLWCRTATSGLFMSGQQVDRMGRPAINTVLIPAGRKNAFNLGAPVNDVRDFRADVVNTLIALGNSQQTAEGLADVLLPDILTVDLSNPAGFLNGRRLEDDVIDAELNLLTGGGLTTDMVDANDVPFRNVFPYLADSQ